MVDLIPGVSRNLWRDNDPQLAAADAEYRAKRPAALARHQHTCQACSVASKDAMEVHHYDCNHANNSEENLQPECVLCHPVNHIGELSSRHTRTDKSELAGGSVRLSYLPELSQADLNHLMRTIGHVLGEGTEEERQQAMQLHEQLASYAQYIEAAWGTSRTAHFAVALRECPQDVYDDRVLSMAGVKVVYPLEMLKQLGARFANEFKAMPKTAWSAIFQQRKPSAVQAGG